MRYALTGWMVAGLVGLSQVASAEPPAGGGPPRESSVRDRVEDVRDRRENVRDRAENAREQWREEAQRLRALKEQDPEAFKRAVQQRREQLKERLAHLK